MNLFPKSIFSSFFAICLCTTAWADIRLPAIFSDHLVLQKSKRVPIWGWADPGEKITVTLVGIKSEATAGTDGKWRVILDLDSLGSGPYELEFSGKNRLIVRDVVIGEVWVCSGQSNMELDMIYSVGAKKEAQETSFPLLREFNVKKKLSNVPLEDCEGKWCPATRDAQLYFGGVAYYFGKQLHQELGVPVGLIRSAWGGSRIEGWMPEAAIDTDPDLKAGKEKVVALADNYPELEKSYFQNHLAWMAGNQRTDRERDQPSAWAQPNQDLSDWKVVELPGDWKSRGLPENGAVWIRREVELDSSREAETFLEFCFPKLGGFQEMYWDGRKIEETVPAKSFPDRAPRFRVGSSDLRAGKHTIALRLFNPSGAGGFLGPARELVTGPFQVSLAGEWRYRVEFELPPLTAEQVAVLPSLPGSVPFQHHVASRLFNGMIHPLIPYAIRGVTWYQGESNANAARQYNISFPLLVRGWRESWNEGDFPFYFCQLANYGQRSMTPGDSAWAELREVQTKGLVLPATGQAILLGTGLTGDIHPVDRQEQGRRLARVALAKTYGRKEPDSGPVYNSQCVEGDRMRIKFLPGSGDLVAAPLPKEDILRYVNNEFPVTEPLQIPFPGNSLQGFAICGKDRVWHWAEASIVGKDTVIARSPKVSEPVAVRYAWSDNPVANLTDASGLPAAPFRTDDFPQTSTARYFLENYSPSHP